MFFDRFTQKNVKEERKVFKVPENKVYVVVGMNIANTTKKDIFVDVKINNIYIVRDAPLAPGSSFVPIGNEQKLIMTEFDELKVTATDFVDVYTSVTIKTV